MGPICGPVVSAAVIIHPGTPLIPGVRDSKTLARLQREELAIEIRRTVAAVAVGAASVREIEVHNILCASRLAMARAVSRLGPVDFVLADGRRSKYDRFSQSQFIVDGDALCYSIACASIVAKVVRDRLMEGLARRYPAFGWERNKGYASVEHLETVRRLGATPYHRQTWTTFQRRLPAIEDLVMDDERD